MTDIVQDCELYAKVIEGIVVVADDWKPSDPVRREPRETLLRAAAEIRKLRLRLEYMESKYGKIDWDAAHSSTKSDTTGNIEGGAT